MSNECHLVDCINYIVSQPIMAIALQICLRPGQGGSRDNQTGGVGWIVLVRQTEKLSYINNIYVENQKYKIFNVSCFSSRQLTKPKFSKLSSFRCNFILFDSFKCPLYCAIAFLSFCSRRIGQIKGLKSVIIQEKIKRYTPDICPCYFPKSF